MTSSMTTRTALRVNVRKCSWNVCCSGNDEDVCSNATGSVFDVVLFFLGIGIVVPSCLKWTVLSTRDNVCLYYLFNLSALRRELVTHNSGWCPAHAGCYSMALSNALASAGFTPTSVHTTARVHFNQVGGRFATT